MVIMVDPPGGWRYGFPKVLDETVTFRKFLLNNGYPREDLDLAENYSRYWEDNNAEGFYRSST